MAFLRSAIVLSRSTRARFASLASGVKRGDSVADVGAGEHNVLVDLAREEALAQRAVGDEADPEFLLMYSGRLFRPRCSSLGPKSKPNLVAITTLARKGANASPTTK